MARTTIEKYHGSQQPISYVNFITTRNTNHMFQFEFISHINWLYLVPIPSLSHRSRRLSALMS
jgi:hypothetical protein